MGRVDSGHDRPMRNAHEPTTQSTTQSRCGVCYLASAPRGGLGRVPVSDHAPPTSKL